MAYLAFTSRWVRLGLSFGRDGEDDDDMVIIVDGDHFEPADEDDENTVDNRFGFRGVRRG